MSKGIIILNMPDRCCNCKMGFVNEYYDQFECYFKPGEEIKLDQEKPDWCPIKETREQPVAFDKKKVIEELKQISKALLMVEKFNGAACIDKAIEVIEKGGIE